MNNKKLKHIISYLLENDEDRQAKAREILNILFLSDWKSAITRDGRTISKSRWRLRRGVSPDSKDFWGALNSKYFIIEKKDSNEENWIIKIVSLNNSSEISKEEKSIIDFVQKYISDNNVNSDALVSKTFPVFTNSDDSEVDINLETASHEYVNQVRENI